MEYARKLKVEALLKRYLEVLSGKAMSLKAKIRNLARKKDMSAQVVLQNYMFERFLERLSQSKYQYKFILKGGMMIAALVGF